MQHPGRAKATRAGTARGRGRRSGRPPRRQWGPILVPVAVGVSMLIFGFGLGAATSIVRAPPSVQQVREESRAELAVRDQTLLACRAALERLSAPTTTAAAADTARAETEALAQQCRSGVVAAPDTQAPASTG